MESQQMKPTRRPRCRKSPFAGESHGENSLASICTARNPITAVFTEHIAFGFMIHFKIAVN